MQTDDPSGRRSGKGRWTALLAIFWLVGAVQSYRMTSSGTDHTDIFADVEQYHVLREILGDARVAAFRTDHTNIRAINSTRFRFQYAVMPTMLHAAYNDEAALRMARNRTRGGDSFHVIYQYQQRRNFVAFDGAIREHAAILGCELVAFEPIERVVVFRFHGCADG